jgi:hypothetical protein
MALRVQKGAPSVLLLLLLVNSYLWGMQNCPGVWGWGQSTLAGGMNKKVLQLTQCQQATYAFAVSLLPAQQLWFGYIFGRSV